VVVAVIAGGLITQFAGALKARADSRREDRRQQVDETSSAVTAAKVLTEASSSVVQLQDAQIDEFKEQIRALQAESSALNTRLDKEIEKRLRAEAATSSIEQQVQVLRNQLAMMRAQFEVADQERTALRRENGAMKTKLFEMSAGISSLMRQVREAGLEPIYRLDVPVMENETRPLGPIDVQAIRKIEGDV